MYTAIRKSLNKENDKGFTLIELLVVIIIIGILAAIAIPIFLNQRKKAVDASAKSDARTIATQLETYYTDLQTYPSSAEYDLVAGPPVVISLGSAAAILAGTAEKVVLSPGNTAAVSLNAAAGSATAFCVIVTNAKATRNYAWQSDAGGLLTTATCGAGFTTVLA